MRVFTCLLLLFCLTAVPRTYMAADNLRVQDKSQDFWLLQARLITDDILKEASELSRLDRALLLGRLSAVWWRHDVEYARAALQKAMGKIEPGSDDESTSQRRKRISVIRTLLTIAAPLDERAGSRLVALLTSEESKRSPEEATDNATGLVKAALIVLDTDPARAAALGSASLRVGKSWSFASLLSKLRRRDRALGDALFNEALATAATRRDRDLLASLTLIAFNGPPADDLRRKVILAISHQFLGSSSQDENTCSLAPVVAPLLEQ
jgi:hypothetical protein